MIALVEPTGAARAAGAADPRELIYDYHTLPLDPDRLLVMLGHINGLVTIERGAGIRARRQPGAAPR